jgi:hypothetical protein
MKLTIETVENGWILTKDYELIGDIPNETGYERMGFTYKREGIDEECETFVDLLNAISDELLPYDKWDKTNVRVVKGHKVE